MSIIVLLVFLLGLFLRQREDKEEIADAQPTQLIADGPVFADSYPAHKFESDEKWESYITSLQDTSTVVLYRGEGKINDNDVAVKFALSPNGEMVGRYRHSNGTTLDLNGYIDSETGDLLVHLGHKKYQSDWKLTPDAENSTVSEYVYQGKWGSKQLPSTLTITKMD